jgi:hypothetical protein
MSSIPIHLDHRIPLRVLRHSKWDALLIGLAIIQGIVLLKWPSAALIALGMWWGANTIAHNFIHRPFFVSRSANGIFSFYLSLILGVPQTLWRQRHLAHHAEREWKLKLTPQLMVEGFGVAALCTTIAFSSPRFFLSAYVPGYACGLLLCWLQGRYEHTRGTVSHYGRFYNFLFFNDGYHVEHHANPAVHWTELARRQKLDERPSRWPAVLRWSEGILGALEKLVLKSKWLQRFVLNRHERAMRKLLVGLQAPKRIGVVGGGLFPRSLIVLKKIYPHAELIGIEGNPKHIEIAQKLEMKTGTGLVLTSPVPVFSPVRFINEWFDAKRHTDFDLLAIPLAYLGNRQEIYQRPPAKTVLVHDWIWNARGRSEIVSPLLLKRINLVQATGEAPVPPGRYAAALLAVLLACKALVLVGRHVDWTPWALAAYVWQDCLVVLLFAIFERIAPRRAGWAFYIAAVIWVAINVPVARMMSTPLTWPMLRAAGGPLLDSIKHQATVANLTCLAIVAAIAALAPKLLKKIHWPLLLAIATIGAIAAGHVDTMGRHRNAFVVLVSSALSRVQARPDVQDWRKSFCEPAGREELPLAATAKGKNVLVIILESAGARYLKTYGAAENPMPNIDSLSQRGIVFENAYTSYPESIKGLMATLCSRYPAIDIPTEKCSSIRTPSIADVMKTAGYRTGLFHSGRFMYLGMRELISGRGFDTLEDAGDIGGNHESSFGIDESSTVKRILAWIDQGKSRSFFAVYMPIAGHHPYDTPTAGPFAERDEIDRYRNALRYADESVAQLIAGLKSRGLLDQTVLILFGDHGEAFGQHDGNFGHTNFIWEENVHVPLIVVPPQMFEQVRVKRAVSLIDIPGTICDLTALNKPAQWQGGSLLRDEQMSLFFTDYSLGLIGLRDGKWKFIYEIDGARSKLFDLNSDPAETKNLADVEKEKTETYRHRLLNWTAAQRDLVLKGH